MIPNSQIDFEIDNTQTLPGLTFKIDTENGRILGKIDGKEALSQTVYKILGDERYAYIIYNWYYGVETIPMIGQDFEFVQANIPKVILDALVQDDRISGIQNLKCTKLDLNSMLVEFEVISSEGIIPIKKEFNNG